MEEGKTGAGAAAKSIVLAFVVGGVFGLIGILLNMLTAAIFGGPCLYAEALSLVIVGIIGLILYQPGIYQKITEASGFGTLMQYCGLACACGEAFMAARKESGSAGKGIAAAFKLVVYVIGTSMIFIVFYALIAVFGTTA